MSLPDTLQKPDTAELHKWSQHYDLMQISVTTLLLASSCAVYAHVKAPCNFDPLISAGGVLLVICSLFAATSYRNFRTLAQNELPSSEKHFIVSDKRIKQWHVNWLLHCFVLWVWFRFLFQRLSPDYVWTGMIATIISVIWIYLQEGEYQVPKHSLLIKGEIGFTSKQTIVISGTDFIQITDSVFRTSENVTITLQGPVEIRTSKK